MKSLTTYLFNRLFKRVAFSSDTYWSQRYEAGRNSGPGSYGHLAEFKATVLNAFVADNEVDSVVEFGCGDGNQLALATYPTYTGYDVSMAAVSVCRDRFRGDTSKRFFLVDEYSDSRATLAISLDVIFHLTEDSVFDSYMRRLFSASSKYVAIYSSNQDEAIAPIAKHVRHRHFSSWIDKNANNWRLVRHIPNPYPYNGDSSTTSFADFYFYQLS